MSIKTKFPIFLKSLLYITVEISMINSTFVLNSVMFCPPVLLYPGPK